MPKVKYGTKEYRNAYNKRSLANYDFNSKTYNLARPLPDIVATPKNNLDLGQVVRNGTSKIGKPIGVAITELAALHPAIGLAKAGVDAKLAVNQRDKILNSLAALPIPVIRNLTKARKIISPVTKTMKKVEPGVTRISLNSPNKELGHIDLSDSFEKTAGFDTIYPEYIKVNEKGKGLSKALYAAGINEFVNDPRAQFVQALLPLPEGLEYLGMVSRKAIKSKAAQLAAKQLNRNIDKTKLIPKSLPSNVGWAPTQSVKVIHDKNNSEALKLFFPERWDVINEGANPFGIWFQGKWGLPREGVKAAKAAKARALFANRPYRVSGTLKLDKPIQTVGEVSNRAALTKSAEQMGADGVIFNNVYDNGYSNNQVIFSFKDLIDGITTKKAAGK